MNREERVHALVQLGHFISGWLQGEEGGKFSFNADLYDGFSKSVARAVRENSWFTERSVRDALASIADKMLQTDRLNSWLSSYSYNTEAERQKPVGIVAAGNIPLVCFHDIMCVLLAGYNVLIKPSSKDRMLVSACVALLHFIDPRLSRYINVAGSFTEEHISKLIATGSGNTARYIEYEYRNVVRLVRKNRSSVAILTGEETECELKLLASDIFSYFGMGCRNVSKLYVPAGYEFEMLMNVSGCWRADYEDNAKLMSRYRYEKAVADTLGIGYVDGGFFILSRNTAFCSPPAVVNVDFFTNLDVIKYQLIGNIDQLQCVVSAPALFGNVGFGKTQQPELTDYADGVDTISWLLNS